MTATHTDDTGQQWVRRCASCKGEQWINGPEVKGLPTIAPCPECRPGTAGLLAAGHYAADAAHPTDERDVVVNAAVARAGTPKTALFPWPQLAGEWPAPGPRTDPATTDTEEI